MRLSLGSSQLPVTVTGKIRKEFSCVESQALIFKKVINNYRTIGTHDNCKMMSIVFKY